MCVGCSVSFVKVTTIGVSILGRQCMGNSSVFRLGSEGAPQQVRT